VAPSNKVVEGSEHLPGIPACRNSDERNMIFGFSTSMDLVFRRLSFPAKKIEELLL